MERYTGCGERHSCIEIHLQNFHYLSGKYCFQGENAARRSQGPVYFKHGMTPQESFWLMRADASRHQLCDDGDWVLQRVEAGKDRCPPLIS
ncbi:unnamed protein product [Symbiodinium natans]|uniref:Uncharacterized protein n=1 Tax=Symbiodinium natans TaxID=878477 RepID=A0A812U650_9DINO|nr:unnamed protein product [Symbiodinium natans]